MTPTYRKFNGRLKRYMPRVQQNQSLGKAKRIGGPHRKTGKEVGRSSLFVVPNTAPRLFLNT